MTIKEDKQKILGNMLINSIFSGWNDKALEKSAEDSGFEASYAYAVFHAGALDIAEFYLNGKIGNISDEGLKTLKHSEKVRFCLEFLVTSSQKEKGAIRKLVAFLSQPQNVLYATKLLYNLSGEIWYKCGDKSVDFSFYTKRLTLAKILGATLLYWLADDSENSQKTLKFIDRQISSVMKFNKMKVDILSKLSKANYFK